MQNRMKTHQLTKEQVDHLLLTAQTCSLATLNSDGSPYVIPVHFVYYNDAIYIHGLPKGQKIGNIEVDPRVSLTVYEMEGLLLNPDGKPCNTNTKYQSVILSGTAAVVDDIEQKKEVLLALVKKFTPQLAMNEMPENMIKGTAVIGTAIQSCTGKYYG